MIDIKNLLQGMAMFGFIIACVLFLVNDARTTDPTFLQNDRDLAKFSGSMDILQDVNKTTAKLQEAITESQPEQGLFGPIAAFISVTWYSVRTLFSGTAFIGKASQGATAIFQLPWFVPGVITILVVLLIAIEIYEAVLRTSTGR
jgi:hypothetical protein